MFKRRKIKNSGKKRILIIGIVFLLIFITLIINKKYISYKTKFPIKTNYKNEIPAKSFNIFDEKVYEISKDGIILYNADEGQKVPKDYEIATLNLMEDKSELNDKLQKLNSAIEYKKLQKDKNKKNKEIKEKVIIKNIENEKNNIIDIQKELKNNNLLKAIENINILGIKTKQTLNSKDYTELINKSLEELIAEKEDTLKKISKSNIVYTSNDSGIVSYKIDGEEKYFNKDIDFSVYTPDYLNRHKKLNYSDTKKYVKKGDKLFSLINNLSYNLAVLVNNYEKIKNIDINETLDMEVDGVGTISGKVIKINKFKNNAVIIFEVNNNFEKMYHSRIHDIKLIINNFKCYEIPKNSIIKRDNLFGVYVQEIRGYVKFIPVEVIVPLKDTSYVSIGDKRGFIIVNNKRYRTIALNDAIVINPKKVDKSKLLD